MPHEELSFGGLAVQGISERVPFEYALVADDAELDRGGIDGRHGYRAASATEVTGSSNSIPTTTIKGATEFNYTSGADAFRYGCLNGDCITIYVDQYGELILRKVSSGVPVAKTAGIGDPTTGFPLDANILTDGQISSISSPPGYGILRSLTSKNGLASAELAIQEKRELLTLGAGTVMDTWSIKGDGDLTSGLGDGYFRSIDGRVDSFGVTGATADVTMTATSIVMFVDAGLADLLEVKHIYTIQDTASALGKTRVKVRVELRNLSGATLTNVRYAHGVDPNPGVTTGSASLAYFTPSDLTAFSVRGEAGQHYVGIGFYDTGSNVVGAQVGKLASASESAFGYSPDTQFAAGTYIKLGVGTAAEYFAGGVLQSSTTNWKTDNTWRNALPSSTSSNGIGVRTPTFSIGAGATQVFEFYYFTYLVPTTDDPQLLLRYRPGTVAVTDARTLPVLGGNVWRITDPGSEIAENGAATLAGTCFDPDAEVSGVQLGKFAYLASDTQGQNWYRMKPDYTLESIAPLSKPTGLTGSTVSPAVTLFSSLTETLSGWGKTANHLGSGWSVYSGSPSGSVTYTLGADADYRGYEWLLIYASCMSRNQPGVYPIKISLLNNAGTEEQVVATLVTNARSEASPSAIYVPLAGLSATLRAAVRKIKFQGANPNVPASYLATYGFIPIPIKPVLNPATYYVSYYNSTTQTESALSDKIEIALTPFTLANYPYLYAFIVDWYYDGNTATAQPDNQPNNVYNYRAESVLPGPSRADLVPLPQIAVPITVAASNADKVRLWALTENPSGLSAGSIRLVKEITNPGTGTLTITDDLGPRTLANQPYKGTGTPPPCRAMAALGGRLAAGGNPAFPNRLYISNFLPFGQDTDPFPSFPDVPVIASDGHSFDLGDSAGEGIVALVAGDKALYLLTNQAAYIMDDLSPFAPIGTGSVPYELIRKGVVSRRGYAWWDAGLVWCSHDGIYLARGRGEPLDLTEQNRSLYRNWLLPDTSTLMVVQDRKIWAIRGTRYMRLDLAQNPSRWTRGTFADTLLHPAAWRDDGNSIEQAWCLASDGLVYRLQPGTGPGDANRATSDAGTAIPNWTYETGYDIAPVSARIKMLYLDTTGAITASAYKDATILRNKTFATAGEHELPIAADLRSYKFRLKLTGANLVTVRRAMYERGPVKGAKGGGTAV